MLPSRLVTRLCSRHLCSAPAAVFRTPVADPTEHSRDDLGQLYTVHPDDYKQLFQVTGLRKSLVSQARTFSELSLMVRRPAVDVMDCLRASDVSRPARRYLLYGRYGAGKSTTVAHLLHWAARAGWLLVHMPEADRWGLRYGEVVPNAADASLIDHPLDAAAWLTHFRQQNAARLAELGLVTRQEYTWSRRESTPVGAPVTDLADLGIARKKYSSQCVQALLSEIKQHANEGRCRVMVAVEKVNVFWDESTVRREDRSLVPFSDFTVVRALCQLLEHDWCGGAVVCTVGHLRRAYTYSHLPRHLLGQPGWRQLDPFVPIRVDDMTRLEAYAMIDYYCERRWLQAAVSGTEEGKQELFFRSGGNPAKLAEICCSY